jgi:membrane protease YdiL (CAAX protease family)
MVMLMSAVSMAIAIPVGCLALGIEFPGFEAFSKDPMSHGSVALLQLVQASNQIMGFGLASLLFVLVFKSRSVSGFLIRKSSLLWLVPIAIILSLPLIELFLNLNSWVIREGGALEEMLMPLEEQATVLTDFLLNMSSGKDLFINLIVMAAIPAVCEELAFRGVIQSSLSKAFNNIHVGIWVSAFIFSAIHMQFYGFLPRLALGAVLGYLLIWTGSMWAPILAHFTNNAFAVVERYIYQKTGIEDNAFTMFSERWYVVLAATILVIVILSFIRRKGQWLAIKDNYLRYPVGSVLNHSPCPIHVRGQSEFDILTVSVYEID